MLTRTKPILFRSPCNVNRSLIPPKITRQPIAPRATATLTVDLVQSSYFIGQGIILFTMFYCTTNWWYYRRTREEIEKKDKEKKHKK